MEDICGANAIESRKQKVESIKTKAESRKNKDYTDNFLKFWEAYPRKEGKGKAFVEFDKIKVNESLLAEMLAAIEVQKNQINGRKIKDNLFHTHQLGYIKEDGKINLCL